MESPLPFLSSHGIEPTLAVASEEAAVAISELSGRISRSSVQSAWLRRAGCSGYAKALQLQGVEIDEVDILSWTCGLALPDRPKRSTTSDEFADFLPWLRDMQSGDQGSWRDALPFTPSISEDLPRLLRALDLQRQYAVRSGSIAAWLALPVFIHRLGVSQSPLPCLVAGSKAFRLSTRVPVETVRATLRALAAGARQGLETLDAMEAARRAALRAIRSEHRPGRLTELMALSLSASLLSPTRVADELGITVAGAGKLLDRAATLELLVEVSGRRSWKTYLTPDLAIALGFRKPRVGRPRHEPPSPAFSPDLAAALDQFDREMAEIDRKLAQRTGEDHPQN